MRREDAHAAETSSDDCLDIAALAKRSGISERTLRRWMADSANPLPSHHVRGGFKDRGRVLVIWSEYLAWVKSFPAGRAAAEDARAWVRKLATEE